MKLLTQMAEEVAQLLRQRGETVVVAETSTGGLLSSALLAVPGASAYYKGGSVLYTYESRKILLGMTRADVEGLAPMSEAMVMAFANKARVQFDATWAIAELGIAGPTGVVYGEAGSSVIGVSGPNPVSALLETGSTDREANMWLFAEHGLGLLHRALTEAEDS
ncbi:MAG: CinA family protein [Gammaproteobacteria bacterium TMED243]|nr:damage-inducible protein [Gammaproteobacteria bacterium]RPG32766.1 MAG: CinA family protein [Gammaproteobacteria bacterium TMED243]